MIALLVVLVAVAYLWVGAYATRGLNRHWERHNELKSEGAELFVFWVLWPLMWATAAYDRLDEWWEDGPSGRLTKPFRWFTDWMADK